MKNIIVTLLVLISTLLFGQRMKSVQDVNKADFKVALVTDSTQADLIVCITESSKVAKKNRCMWKIVGQNKMHDYTFKNVQVTDEHDFKVYISEYCDCVRYKSEFLKMGLEEYIKYKKIK